MASDTPNREYRIQDVSDLVESGAPEPTLGQLVATASRQASELVRAEIALAKAEVTQSAKAGGKGAGKFAGAAFFGLSGLGFLPPAGGAVCGGGRAGAAPPPRPCPTMTACSSPRLRTIAAASAAAV